MIGKLSGRVEYRAEDHVLLDVNGVGYLVYCSERTLLALPRDHSFVSIYTDLIVREDLLQLYGFLSLAEKEWHRLLMSVQGIGAKASLAILGTLGVEGVSNAVALGDWNALKSAKGVGPKTAQRVVNELKDKAALIMARVASLPTLDTNVMEKVQYEVAEREHAHELNVSEAQTQTKDADTQTNPDTDMMSLRADAMSALANLGYAPAEAASAVAQVIKNGEVASSSPLIRDALKRLAPKDF